MTRDQIAFSIIESDILIKLTGTGETLVIGSSIGFEGLEDGFEFDFGLNQDGNVQLLALNDGVFAGGDVPVGDGAVPEPATWLIWIGLGLLALISNRYWAQVPRR